MKSKSLQHLIKIRLKHEPLHVARGPVFSATDDVFSVTSYVFEASGRGAASECQKGERAGCFWIPRGEPFWSKRRNRPGSPKRIQKSGKGHPKSIQKTMPKKDTECIPKAFQNDAKTDTKIIDLLYLCEKGWNAPNCLFSNRKRGSDHVERFQDLLKIYPKSVLKWDMEKEHKKDVKMVPICEPKSHKKWEMEWKRHAKK